METPLVGQFFVYIKIMPLKHISYKHDILWAKIYFLSFLKAEKTPF